MTIIIYIAILTLILLIFGMFFDEYPEKLFTVALCSMAIIGGISCVPALILSAFNFLVVLLVLIYSAAMFYLFMPKS